MATMGSSFMDEIIKKKAMDDNYLNKPFNSQREYAESSPEIAFQAPQSAAVQQAPMKSGGELAAEVGTNAAAGGAMGGVAGAGIAAGGTLLTNYIAQKAADERQRRQNAAAIEQNYAQNQTNAYNSILGNLGKALR